LAHILRTKAYYEDYAKNQLTPNPNLLKLKSDIANYYTNAIQGTAALWHQEYNMDYLPISYSPQQWSYWKAHEQNDTFDHEVRPDYAPPPGYATVIGPPLTQKISVSISISLTVEDLVEDVKWLSQLEQAYAKCRTTLNKWRKEPFENIEVNILKDLLLSYYRFLYLVNLYPAQSTDFTPPLTIDLMWHAHMSLTTIYTQETSKILGETLAHHPWKTSNNVEPISPESVFSCLWKEVFKTSLSNEHIWVNRL